MNQLHGGMSIVIGLERTVHGMRSVNRISTVGL